MAQNGSPLCGFSVSTCKVPCIPAHVFFGKGARAQPSVIRVCTVGYSIQRPAKQLSFQALQFVQLSPAFNTERERCLARWDSSIVAALWCGHRDSCNWPGSPESWETSSPFVSDCMATVLSGLSFCKEIRRAARAENCKTLQALEQLHDLLFEGLRRLHRPAPKFNTKTVTPRPASAGCCEG